MKSKNLYKLIGITYISICLKNILQILVGTLFNSKGELSFYSLNNENVYSFKYILWIIILYDFFLLLLFYIAIYFLLYYVIKIKGNKLWIQISYIAIIYSFAMFIIEHGNYYIEYTIIPIILGFSNWWMFKKWISDFK